MLDQGVAVHRFTEPEEAAACQPGVFCRITPAGGSRFDASVARVSLGEVALVIGQVSPCLGRLTIGPDRAAIQLPLSNLDSLVVNGVGWCPGLVGAYAAGAELLRASRQENGFATIVLPFPALDRLLEPQAAARLRAPGDGVLLRAGLPAWRQAKQIARMAQETMLRAPGVVAQEAPRRALREALLQAVNELLLPAGEIPFSRSFRTRRRIITSAEEYLCEHRDRPIYTDELCGALAVSASSLAEAFRMVFGISPHRFLKLRRLGMVRAELRDRDRPRPLVKSVALSHGFWHLGQFAHDYRDAFGESPSETVARAHGPAA